MRKLILWFISGQSELAMSQKIKNKKIRHRSEKRINVPAPPSVFASKNTWGSNEWKNISMIRVDTFQKDSWENEAYSSSCRPIGRTNRHCATLIHPRDTRGWILPITRKNMYHQPPKEINLLWMSWGSSEFID